jgi:integrase
VFRNERGGPLRRANFRQRVWQPALDRSGLAERPTFHDLRHCYATWLVSDGVPVNVQAVMGHEQASTTLNRYTHVPADFPRPGAGRAECARRLFAACHRPGSRRRPLVRGADLR